MKISKISHYFSNVSIYMYHCLQVYGFEKADGAGRAQDIVLQGFTRFSTLAVLPVVFSAGVLYLLVSKGVTMYYMYYTCKCTVY